jgi:hypothetical protein
MGAGVPIVLRNRDERFYGQIPFLPLKASSIKVYD